MIGSPDARRPESPVVAVDIPPLMAASNNSHGLMRRVVMFTFGLLLFAVGVLGWIIPIIPGFPLMIAGGAAMSFACPPVRHGINWLEARLPLKLRLLLRPRLRASLVGSKAISSSAKKQNQW